MSADSKLEESHQACSNFIRGLVQDPNSSTFKHTIYTRSPPKKIVQFWDELDHLPEDVGECIETWKELEELGVERFLFGKHQAREFIRRRLGRRYEEAYSKCYHPAMQSDYFRLCYILVEGGCYIDTDDVYEGAQIQHLFNDGRLKLQPLCYDISTEMMVPPTVFTKPGANATSWIFYFNNNPLIAASGHPLINRALEKATQSLEKEVTSGLPEIQATTGPGNLTKSIFEAATEDDKFKDTLLVMSDWENIAKSRWDLSYRNDTRNWRLSNCQLIKNDVSGKTRGA